MELEAGCIFCICLELDIHVDLFSVSVTFQMKNAYVRRNLALPTFADKSEYWMRSFVFYSMYVRSYFSYKFFIILSVVVESTVEEMETLRIAVEGVSPEKIFLANTAPVAVARSFMEKDLAPSCVW